jgi:hypothetical protein
MIVLAAILCIQGGSKKAGTESTSRGRGYGGSITKEKESSSFNQKGSSVKEDDVEITRDGTKMDLTAEVVVGDGTKEVTEIDANDLKVNGRTSRNEVAVNGLHQRGIEETAAL